MGEAPNVYGEGILFAFSGLDGPTHWSVPLVASTTGEGPGLRFHLDGEPVLRIGVAAPAALEYRAATGDVMVAGAGERAGALVVAFVSEHVIAGRAPAGAEVVLEGATGGLALAREAGEGVVRFGVAYDAADARAARASAAAALGVPLEALVEERLGWFRGLPSAPEGTDPGLARTLAKAFSVMKVNVYAPEGRIRTRWTTPDRWPHRNMWLWDSAFHSLGLMHMDGSLAREALEAVVGFQRGDGFIPIQMCPERVWEITQPPILGWAAWQVCETGERRDGAFLSGMYEAVGRHVDWCMGNRRLAGEADLFRWQTGDESGADNSPRFDGGPEFAAVDLSSFLASECRALGRMAGALGRADEAAAWAGRAERIGEAARRHLWDEARGFFFDRRGAEGEWVDVWSHSGFLPLWAGIATEAQAARLVGHLGDARKFAAPMSVPSVALDDPAYRPDMWRGPVWININYLIIRGLQAAGHQAEAAALREATLGTVAKWYGRTGVLHEFYDAEDATPPGQLDRKRRLERGEGLPVIHDYHWTAALVADLVLRPEA